jgi:FMN reductase
MSARFHPLIVGIGGTTRADSSCEKALRCALARAKDRGAEVELLAGAALDLPMYAPENPARTAKAKHLISLLRRAHGLIVASPGYHGSMSGLIKNALDYTEDMGQDEPPYLEGRAVGLIACASGWQATGTTVCTMRFVIHALRGWPTPLAVAINSKELAFDAQGVAGPCAAQINELTRQVVEFAHMRHAHALVGGERPLDAVF